jgi:hypothetical protein
MTIAPLTGTLQIGKDGLTTSYGLPVHGFMIDADNLMAQLVFLNAGFNVDYNLTPLAHWGASLPSEANTDMAAAYIVPCQIIEREKVNVW